MNQKRVLRQLIDDSLYVVDARLVADAILLRVEARRAIPEIAFRNDRNPRSVRSFRLQHEARSFRLSRSRRTRELAH